MALRRSLRLEVANPVPVVVGTPVRTSILNPEYMSPLPQMLLQRAMPVFLCASGRAPVLFPQKVGSLANALLKAQFRFRTARHVIAVGSHLAAPTDVDSGGKALEFCVGYQTAVGGCLKRFCLVSRVVRLIFRLSERDGIGVNDSATAVQYVDQSLHCSCPSFRGPIVDLPTLPIV